MSRYARRLDRDLTRWREAGWITPEGETSIRADVAASTRSVELASVLGVLGGRRIGSEAMSFVAAYWNEIQRLISRSLSLGGLSTAYGLPRPRF